MTIKVQLGQLFITPAAKAAIPHKEAIRALTRHASGDWGELSEDDKAANDEALEFGDRLLSSYKFSGIRFWIITEADRSITTILMPNDY